MLRKFPRAHSANIPYCDIGMDDTYLHGYGPSFNYLPEPKVAYYSNGKPVFMKRSWKKHGRKAKRKRKV